MVVHAAVVKPMRPAMSADNAWRRARQAVLGSSAVKTDAEVPAVRAKATRSVQLTAVCPFARPIARARNAVTMDVADPAVPALQAKSVRLRDCAKSHAHPSVRTSSAAMMDAAARVAHAKVTKPAVPQTNACPFATSIATARNAGTMAVAAAAAAVTRAMFAMARASARPLDCPTIWSAP